jgi:hypothetical protein
MRASGHWAEDEAFPTGLQAYGCLRNLLNGKGLGSVAQKGERLRLPFERLF